MVANSLAESLCPILAELASGAAYSKLLDLDLSTSPCCGRAKQLIIGQCDVDGVDWSSMIRSCWIAHKDGFQTDHDWQYWPTTKQLDNDDFAASCPKILFATDGKKVRLWCKFGVNWRRVRLAQVNDQGQLVAGSVVLDEFYSH